MIVIFYLSLCSPSFILVKRRFSNEHANSIFRISAIREEMTLLTYTLKKEAEMSSENSVNVYQEIWCYIPDNVTLYHDGCDNLKLHSFRLFLYVAVKDSSSSLDTKFAIISKWFSIKTSDLSWRIQVHIKLRYSCIKFLVNSKCDKDGEENYVYTEF
jgi:hypothetical protein